jgi:hypothetical protein
MFVRSSLEVIRSISLTVLPRCWWVVPKVPARFSEDTYKDYAALLLLQHFPDILATFL